MRRPRFIAGAVCPSCGVVDRTVLEERASTRERRCIDCGHRETQPLDALAGSTAPLPATRVDAVQRASGDVPVERIRLLGAGDAKGDSGTDG